MATPKSFIITPLHKSLSAHLPGYSAEGEQQEIVDVMSIPPAATNFTYKICLNCKLKKGASYPGWHFQKVMRHHMCNLIIIKTYAEKNIKVSFCVHAHQAAVENDPVRFFYSPDRVQRGFPKILFTDNEL